MTFYVVWVRRLVLGLALGLALVSSQRALAHVALLRSEPADGATLTTAPSEFALWFNEPIAPRFSAVQLLDGQGQAVNGLDLQPDAAEPTTLRVHLPVLPAGAYTLLWKTLSVADGHFSQGMVLFGVNVAAPSDPVVPAPPVSLPWVEIGLRWLNFVSLAGLVGAVVVAWFVYQPRLAQPAGVHATSWRQVQGRMVRLAGWCVLVAWLTGMGLLARQVWDLLPTAATLDAWRTVSWSFLVQTRWGSWWLVRQSLLLGLAAVLAGRRDGGVWPQRWMAWLTLTLGGGVLAVQAMSGHAASNPRTVWLAVPLTTLHLWAASVWVGGLLALVVGWSPVLWQGQERRLERLWLGFQPFSRWAALSVGVLMATGLYNSGQQVPSLDALLLTSYGWWLLSKVGLVLLAGVLGLLNATLLHPPVAALLARSLRRPPSWRPVVLTRFPLLVLSEVVIGGMILLLCGVLTASAPPRGVAYTLAPEAEQTRMEQSVDDLQVTLEVKPNRPGANVFSVHSVSRLATPPAEIVRVLLRFTYGDGDFGRVSTKLAEVAPGRYWVQGDPLKLAGVWQIDVVTRRHGLEDSVAHFNWLVLPTATLPPTVFSKRSLSLPLSLAALAIGLLVVAGLIAWRWLVRRQALGSTFAIADTASYPRITHPLPIRDLPPMG